MKPRCNLLVLALGIVLTTALTQNAFGRHFRAAANYSVAHAPIAIAAGDFTGHGKIDLAVRHLDNTISVLRGHGDGTFDSAVHYQLAAAPGTALAALNQKQSLYLTGNQLVASVSADFNCDGVSDQALTASGKNRVSILLGERASLQLPPTGNILQNPGFESGALPPWYVARNFCSSPCRPWTIATVHPRTGVYDAGDMGNIEMRQDFTAVSTSIITKVVMWIRHPSGVGLPAAVDFFYTDGTDDEFLIFTPDQNWDVFDLTADLESGKMLSGISVFGFSGGGVTPTTFVDNASILTQ
ncbi:MAG TPA: hypothetical protein VFA68_01480 [Terriglobales bacterium]|nr:hypothetical protein [Terriglobales bacterium]